MVLGDDIGPVRAERACVVAMARQATPHTVIVPVGARMAVYNWARGVIKELWAHTYITLEDTTAGPVVIGNDIGPVRA